MTDWGREAFEHPQIVGIAGVALGVVGTALLVGGDGRAMTLLAGYAYGAATVALGIEVLEP